MATHFDVNWDSSWTDTSIVAASISNGSTETTSAAIDNDSKATTEVSVEVTYGSTANYGALVFILREYDDGSYEGINDQPFGYELPAASSQTRRRTISVPANRVSKFKVLVSNPTGGTITATVRYKQSTLEQMA